jgi:hypothetical protein
MIIKQGIDSLQVGFRSLPKGSGECYVNRTHEKGDFPSDPGEAAEFFSLPELCAVQHGYLMRFALPQALAFC